MQCTLKKSDFLLLFFGCVTQHMRSYETRGWTCTLCSGSEESKPLDFQGSPMIVFLKADQHPLPWWLRWWRIHLQCGRPGFYPWVGKIPLRGNSYPLHYSGLENSVDYIAHGVAKSRTRLSDFHFHNPLNWILKPTGSSHTTGWKTLQYISKRAEALL